MFGQRRTISTPSPSPVITYETHACSVKKLTLTDARKTQRVQNQVERPIEYSSIKLKPVDVVNVAVIPGAGFVAGRTNTITNAYNIQAQTYIDTLATEQARLIQSNDAFLTKTYSSNPTPKTSVLRNRGDWNPVKRLVVRDELMKIQIGGKTDLPITDAQYAELVQKLDGVDLNNMNDPHVNTIINDLLHPNDQVYVDALKAFKRSGKVDGCFQTSKLNQLQEYLEGIDLGKITAKEFKYIKDNFIEKTEIHHRTSISSDPTQQSNIDNLDTLNTTQHDAKHTDPKTGKIDYKRKLNEAPLDRKGELAQMNKDRVLNENLTGLGVAVAIGLGTGFAIGFVVSLAQSGINPNGMKYAFVAGARQSVSSAGMAASGFIIGKTIGAAAGKSLTEAITQSICKNATEQTLQKIREVCNTGAAGALVTLAFSVYEFAKLKCAGYTTRECMLRVGKSAALSISIVIVSMVAVWAGASVCAVSIVCGIVMTGYSVMKIHHNKRVAKDVTFYSIELCRPVLQAR